MVAGTAVVMVTGSGLRRVERRVPVAGRILRAGGAGALGAATFLPLAAAAAGFFLVADAAAGVGILRVHFVVLAGFAAADFAGAGLVAVAAGLAALVTAAFFVEAAGLVEVGSMGAPSFLVAAVFASTAALVAAAAIGFAADLGFFVGALNDVLVTAARTPRRALRRGSVALLMEAAVGAA